MDTDGIPLVHDFVWQNVSFSEQQYRVRLQITLDGSCRETGFQDGMQTGWFTENAAFCW
jgi:hypothetical protein